MPLTRESLIEWAAGWVPIDNRARFAEALAGELKDWRDPEPGPIFCKNCPFARHVHYETKYGKLIAPGCTGFEAQD